MEYAGSIINSAHFGHQRLGCSLQQCSALLLNAGARLFFSFFFLHDFVLPVPPIEPWDLLRASYINPEPIKSCHFPILSTLEFVYYIKAFLPD